MIYVVPYDDRRLTTKSCRKIMKLFPDEDICLIELKNDYCALKWTEKIARYFRARGKKVYVEITNAFIEQHIDTFAEMGCHLVFIWYGVAHPFFIASFNAVTLAIYVTDKFHIEATVKYIPVEHEKTKIAPMADIETNLEFMIKQGQERPLIHFIFAYPIPWTGKRRRKLVKHILDYLKERDKSGICKQIKCGDITILPNTNIYPCRYSPRKIRKQFFGNADRDKSILGTLRRGFFREKQPCNICGEVGAFTKVGGV